MARHNRKKRHTSPIYTFAGVWLVAACFLPMYRLWALLLTLGLSSFCAYLMGKHAAKKEQKQAEAPAAEAQPAQQKTAAPQKSYGPEIDPILQEGNRALSEMGRIYMSVQDVEVRKKINELMRITDKITQDAIHDPSDIPQIKKFMNYYLPTTIKLLNAYDRMSAQGIEGENLDKSMKSINEMLDQAIVAYKKRLDSLFENQALDIETDIEVMNQMLAREGLSGGKDFEL
ncbi:MAG: 5-bromo-4-chloroindolyl phosphate hydrolysis family protein [Candidatus Limivicinus sp.]|nr:5-bromo-4-chloroindolyl phosphate hydrolysis family protein [Candidatus Limivicinus sp.]MDY5564002.1 5-bromo-4-chloroindolyl phosphate hydrolysis family protein [Candidatus Limivicinus sp.]